jgi:hypothetical protein
VNSRLFKLLTPALVAFTVALSMSVPSQGMAASPSPTPQSSASASPTSAPTPAGTIVAVYPDTKAPLVKSFATSIAKEGGFFNLTVQLVARVHRNALASISIVLSPKNEGGLTIDPLFQAPCTKLGSLSSTALSSTGELASLQSRTLDGDWYLETHVFTSSTKLGAGQDICPGKYLISAINLVDVAKHTVSITANLGSTATAKSNFNDAPSQQSNIWATHPELVTCPQAANLSPVTTTVSGKSTTTIPATAVTLRTTCDHTVDFTKAYIIIVPNSAISSGSAATSTATNNLPIIDYVALVKTALSENDRLKSQQGILGDQIAELQKRIQIYQGGGKATPTPSSSPGSTLAIVDYQKLAKDLQLQVAALTKELAALQPKATPKATPKVTPKVSTKATPKATTKVTAKATPGSTRGSRTGQNRNSTSRPTSWPSPTPKN